MKVLSIKEPFATLIANGLKKIETRSWKTNYRGEIFIHASGKSLAKEYLTNDFVLEIIKDLNMNYGNIICRCNLTDVQLIYPIQAKGKLNIWNFEGKYKLMK